MEIFGSDPGRRVIIYFAATIIVGAILLSLPISAASGSISFVDALFTSTSATCVTGLVVVNTATDFSRFGQVVIMVLIQLGGLGIMTFATGLLLMMGTRLSFQNRLGLTQTLGAGTQTRSLAILKAVVFTTLIIEGLGAVALFFKFLGTYPAGEAAFHAVFHAVCAFCNAGFSTFPNNLESYWNDLSVILVIAFLIIFGGLGFAVFGELFHRIRFKDSKLSLHTKLCVTTTLILIVGGTIALCLAEYGNIFKTTGFGYGVANCFFQSVTARTAGFDTILQSRLTDVSVMLTIILMFIGVCPGSTGGGIKTTTTAAIILLVYRRFAGKQAVTAFKRSISPDSIVRALSVALLAALIIIVMFALLMFVEERPMAHSASSGMFVDILFEVVSAFGTVGLSLGITPNLQAVGKIVIILTMFIGRVGLLTLAFALARPPKKGEIVFVDESVIVG